MCCLHAIQAFLNLVFNPRSFGRQVVVLLSKQYSPIIPSYHCRLRCQNATCVSSGLRHVAWLPLNVFTVQSKLLRSYSPLRLAKIRPWLTHISHYDQKKYFPRPPRSQSFADDFCAFGTCTRRRDTREKRR